MFDKVLRMHNSQMQSEIEAPSVAPRNNSQIESRGTRGSDSKTRNSDSRTRCIGSQEQNVGADKDEDKLKLKGKLVKGNKASYRVMRLLGAGGFGAVYLVSEGGNSTKLFAMKCEQKLETRKDSKLKMEIAILKLVSAEKRQPSHFTPIYDRGRTDTYFFLVMEYVGKSLYDLKLLQQGSVFSMGTGIACGIQCLEACEDLHKHGFIHRDIKPANFACGKGDKIRVVYMLDFGISRRIVNNKGIIKTPRNKVRFKGTVRFASLGCHKGKELGTKDDCESWFYLLIDLVKPGGLPWRLIEDRVAVQHMKEECRGIRKDTLLSFTPCKADLHKIMLYFDEQEYQNKVDYDYVYKSLARCAETCKVNLQDPYDWELNEEQQ